MTVRYFILKQKNPRSQIYIRFWNGRIYDAKTKTGLAVLYDDWSEKKQKVKPKSILSVEDREDVNNKLENLEKYVCNKYNHEYNNGDVIAADWLKNTVKDFFNRPSDLKAEKVFFVDWIKSFVETAPKRLHKGNNLSESTIKKYNTTLNNLINFESEKGKRLRFEDITLNFYFDFVDYCRNNLKLGINTIGTRIKAIKFFCRQIDLEGLPISQHYKHPDFVAQEEKATDVYLTTAEIQKVFNYDFSDMPYLDNARDLLIIGLNTGLRISDFMRLDLSHIKDDTIRIKAQKTGKTAEIPINEQIERTLQKNGGKLPRSISEQKFNEYLKEIGEKVGFTEMVHGAKMDCINEDEAKIKGVKKLFRKVSGTFPKYELMTSHICRRSFATNLYGQIPTPVIMAITGHATETQFLTYIKKTAAENAEVLRNFYKRKAEENGLEFNLKVI
ncbi:MAG: tyrosine-type recombinase/integrase [Chryseobacterium sp.]|nr:tyrosine-type recombinase/integrase [Chryseobacterium sp.]